MYVIVNGAFGVGKTTVARALAARLPGAVLFDPEWIGFVLKRMPGYRHSDFQHLASWRPLTILAGRAVGVFASHVVVPMAFSDPAYLREVRDGLAAGSREVHHVCLTAPLDVVRARWAARGEPADDPRFAWVHRRALECCAAHQRSEFAVHVPTEGTQPEALAVQIVELLQRPSSV